MLRRSTSLCYLKRVGFLSNTGEKQPSLAELGLSPITFIPKKPINAARTGFKQTARVVLTKYNASQTSSLRHRCLRVRLYFCASWPIGRSQLGKRKRPAMLIKRNRWLWSFQKLNGSICGCPRLSDSVCLIPSVCFPVCLFFSLPMLLAVVCSRFLSPVRIRTHQSKNDSVQTVGVSF